MTVRYVEGQLPYTGGTGIGIDTNKVISLLLREENNLIQVNDNNEIYTDLQLVKNIKPTDDFPVGVCVGSVTVNDGWFKSGLILNYKTTSGDYGRWLYADGKIYYDGNTGTFKEIYFAEKVDQLFNELATVAHTGDYNDLINKPEFLQVQADWNQEDTTQPDYIKNKPEIISAKDGQLTIKRNGSTVGTFTANQEDNTDVNITVPSVINNVSSTSETNALSAKMGKELAEKIEQVELAKSPNCSIVGTPTIVDGNISGFSASNYLIVPFLSGFAPFPFIFHMDIVTGTNVSAQQNIIDSDFGLALAIKDGKFLMSLSSNGTSWDIGSSAGTHLLEANSYYCVELEWTGSAYTLRYSLNKLTYTTDITITSNKACSGTPLYLGGYGPLGTHAFLGTFNFNEWQFSSGAVVVWKGMDDAGLATRANVALSNLNEFGEARFDSKQDKLTEANAGTNVTITEEGGVQKINSTVPAEYVKFTDLAGANKPGLVAGGNRLTVNQTTGKMEAGELTKAQFDSADGKIFVGKTTLNNVLSNSGFLTKDVDDLTNYTKTSDLSTVATTGSYNDLSNKPTIPTVNNSTVTIKAGDTTIDSFTLNQSSDKEINLGDIGGMKVFALGSLSDYTNATLAYNYINGGNICILNISGYGYCMPINSTTFTQAKRNTVAEAIIYVFEFTVSSGNVTGITRRSYIGYNQSVVSSLPSSPNANTLYFITA